MGNLGIITHQLDVDIFLDMARLGLEPAVVNVFTIKECDMGDEGCYAEIKRDIVERERGRKPGTADFLKGRLVDGVVGVENGGLRITTRG